MDHRYLAGPTHADQPPRLASVRTAARLLDVPERTIRGWIRRSVIESVRIGGRRLIMIERLRRLVEAKERRP